MKPTYEKNGKALLEACRTIANDVRRPSGVRKSWADLAKQIEDEWPKRSTVD